MKSTKNLGCRRPPKGCGRTDGRADPKGGRRAAPRPPDVAGGPKGAASASASFTLACVRRGAGAHSGWPRSPAPRPTACACPPPPPRWQDGDRGGGAAGGGSGREDGTILSRHAKWTGAAARTVCMGGLRDTIATRGGDGPPLNQKRGATVAAASVGRGSRPPPPRSTPLTGASAGGRTKPGPRLAAGEGGAAHPSGVAPCREGIGGGGGGTAPPFVTEDKPCPQVLHSHPPFSLGEGESPLEAHPKLGVVRCAHAYPPVRRRRRRWRLATEAAGGVALPRPKPAARGTCHRRGRCRRHQNGW